MNLTFRKAHVDLDRDGSIRLRDAAGVHILCLSGAIWVTQHLDIRDIVVLAGEALDIDRPGVTLVNAIEPSRIVLDDANAKTNASLTWGKARRSLACLSRVRRSYR